MASCMAVPRSEIVHDKIIKSDLNEPEAQCFACWLWLPKHWAMSSALLAQPPPLANLASMQLHKEQQQTIPSIWLRILAESALSCYAYLVAAEVQANACKGPCSENHSDYSDTLIQGFVAADALIANVPQATVGNARH